MWSFGMQSRPMFHVGGNPDIEGVVNAAAKAGIKDAVIFGKDHTGLCFHPTKYGVEHPNTKINLTKEMTEALHRHGMRAIAYFNLGLDGEMGRKHPDWLQEHEPGKNVVTQDHWANICVFHEYFHEYTMPVLMEMFDNYKIDGLFLDTMNAFGYCCCPKCKADFEQDMKRPMPLPDDKDNPDWNLYGPWQYKRTFDYMQKLRDMIHSKYPDAEIIFNHIGGPNFPHALPGIETGIVSCDPAAAYPWISLYSSFLSSLEFGGDIFIERFSAGWGDRCDLDDRTLQYKSASIFGHRQRFCVGDRMHPDARFADGSKHAMEVISDVWKKFNKALPDRFERKDDFLFLFPDYRYGAAKKRFSKPDYLNPPYRDSMLGPFCFLLDSGFSYQTVPEFALKRNLTKDKVVIVSGAEGLMDETHAQLRDFVKQGGKILFAGRIPMMNDGSLPDYCGISAAEKSYHTCVYLSGKVKYSRTLVCGTVWDITLNDAVPLLYGYPQQYAKGLGKSPYPYYNASADEPMDIPLLTVSKYGKGQVFFLNCGLLEDYANTDLPAQRKWGKDLLKKLKQTPDVWLESNTGSVELISYEDPLNEEKVIVLINHGGRTSSKRYLFVAEHISDPQPAYAVELMIKTDNRVTVKDGSKDLQFKKAGKNICVPITMDTMWKFITVKKKNRKQ